MPAAVAARPFPQPAPVAGTAGSPADALPLRTVFRADAFEEACASRLGYEADEVSAALDHLQGALKRRRGALHLAAVGGRWAMEVKPKVAAHLTRETKTYLPPRLLKAASLIAYHQPMP